jgi:pristinamycin I synthase-3/4
MLGVLKAGAAYIPLDVDYPQLRLEFMIQDSQAAILLTQETLLDRIPDFEGVTICLDRDLFESLDSENPLAIGRPDNLAYTIYTSGSTGQPKGILTPHRGVVNYINFMIDAYHLDSDSVTLQLPSVSFDPSVRDIFGTLAAGGKLVLVSNEEAKDPAALAGKINHFRVNSIFGIVPTLLRAILDVANTEGMQFESLALLLVSGESLTWLDWERARSVFGKDLLMVNQYGPTEITMIASYFPINDKSPYYSSVPIGRPIWNMRMYILDHSLNPVPIGVTGELYIGGVGVTRGYNAQPGLTAKVFIPDPFAVEPGERMYKTGDIARYLENGNIQFLGRADRQVKIRGLRVELGEIEVVLESNPFVKRAAVMVWEERLDEQPVAVESMRPNINTPGSLYEASASNRLVAYIVSTPGEHLTGWKLRNFLNNELPDFMVPSNFVFLEELPLTPTGKVDRKHLPYPKDAMVNENQYTPPRTHLEHLLTDIWRDVLGLEYIGIDNNFFAVGGHSLLAVQVISRVNEELEVEVPVRTLFEKQTIAQLAAYVETLLDSGKVPPLQDEISSVDWVEGKI